MVQNMMKGMNPKDMPEMMQEMMPRCMDMMFAQMEPEKRSVFAAEILSRVGNKLKKYAAEEPEKDNPATPNNTGDKKMGEVPDKGRCASKKDLLGNLIASLLQDMPEEEKKRSLHSVMQGDGEHRQTIEMVEH